DQRDEANTMRYVHLIFFNASEKLIMVSTGYDTGIRRYSLTDFTSLAANNSQQLSWNRETRTF
ncbi:MAG: hypothetical protein Q7T25_15410, partial [Sideroxyarcus sp.]|nr:hypothetical protein [Sideroxyarcus sp.]